MTTLNQKFSMFAGDTKYIVVPVVTPEGTPVTLTGTTIKWGAREIGGVTNVISKQTPTITIAGNVITIKLLPADTSALSGIYYHECEITDQQSNVSTIFAGTVTIYKSGV